MWEKGTLQRYTRISCVTRCLHVGTSYLPAYYLLTYLLTHSLTHLLAYLPVTKLPAQALFNEAVEVHPHLRSARGHLRRIENLLGQGNSH